MPTPTHVSITLVNEDKHCRFYEDHEPLEEGLTQVEVYKRARSEYGRCKGKVYIDTPNGPKAIGWTFEKRARYTDRNDTHLQTAWVSLAHIAPAVIQHVILA